MKLPQILLILLILLPNVAPAANINYMVTVTGCDETADQEQINAAINQVAEAGGGTVNLPAGLYVINGPIVVHSNIVLSGDPDAIVQVDEHSTHWFTGSTGLITTGKDSKGKYETLKHVEICGFQIDGNIGKLPSGYADSRSDTSHDCEKAILLAGSSGSFMEDIIVHDMYIHDTFSDGVYMRYVTGAAVYNMKISNCQHECVYLSVAHKSTISYCQLAGICSDNLRLDNCDTCKVSHNICFSYNGESYGQYKHGENAIQIGDAGSSHGYNAKKVGFPTRDIEVCDNTFSDPGLKTVWLHNGDNVYVHDNKYVDAEKLVTSGTSVDLTERGQHIDFTDNGEPISYDNPPTQEQSEQVFSSIFDYMGLTSDYSYVSGASDNSYYNGKLYNNANDVDCVFEKHVTMDGNYTLIKIDTTDISSITYTINGSVSKHILKIGVRQGMNVIYSDSSIWEGNAEHDIYGNVYLNDTIDGETVSVQCTAPSGDVSVNRVHTVVNDGGISLNVKLLICILIALLPALFGIILLRKLIRSIVMY